MREEIFFENLLKILRRGEWKLSGEECLVFEAVYRGVLERSKPPIPKPVEEPIKEKKKNGTR